MAGKSKEQIPENIMENFEKYKGKSKSELMSELMSAVTKQKMDGTFSKESIKKFYAQAAPLLSDEQKKQMHELIDKITS